MKIVDYTVVQYANRQIQPANSYKVDKTTPLEKTKEYQTAKRQSSRFERRV